MQYSDSRSRPVVLVVEDEYLVRMHAAAVIEDAGYDVIEACNADEAISLLEARKDIRIVFTDIEMPGSMDGLKLAHAVRHRWPPIQLILTSGRHCLKDHQIPMRSRFLSKPYEASVLIATMQDFSPH
jgi:two-component system, response regulator PdtaR